MHKTFFFQLNPEIYFQNKNQIHGKNILYPLIDFNDIFFVHEFLLDLIYAWSL